MTMELTQSLMVIHVSEPRRKEPSSLTWMLVLPPLLPGTFIHLRKHALLLLWDALS